MDGINVPLLNRPTLNQNEAYKYLNTNLISRIFFFWVSKLLSTAQREPFEQSTHYGLRSNEDSLLNFERFRENWYKSRRIFKALWMTFYGQILRAYVITTINNALGFSTPFFVYQLINYINSEEQTPPIFGINYGIALLIGIAISRFFLCLFDPMSTFAWYMLGTNMTNALNAMIYYKSLNFSMINTQEHTAGSLTNHMQVDTMKLTFLFQVTTNAINFPLQVGVVFFSLFLIAGPAFAPGLSVLIITSICSYITMQKYFGAQKRIMDCKDKRLRVANEVLNNIKFIKMSGWERCFSEKLGTVRQLEINSIARSFTALFFNIILNWFTPMAVLTALFIYMAFAGETLTPTNAFTILSLANLLQGPFVFFSRFISSLSETILGLNRVSTFLNAREIDRSYIKTIINDQNELNDKAIEIRNGNFYWVEESEKMKRSQIGDNKQQNHNKIHNDQPEITDNHVEPIIDNPQNSLILENINIDIKKKTFTAIIGDVGAGKSSFFYSLVGEMNYPKDSKPSVNIYGKICFTPQKPWILNDTVKNNIIFGQEYDEERYNDAVLYSCLEADLKILPKGDLTDIGEKGVNLSGGQKARVSLARALYSRNDIYFFDDPLSAVDAHVGSFIVQNCFLKYLKSKTIILATHNIDCLKHTDRVMILEKGKIVVDGRFNEVSKTSQFMEIVEKSKKKEEEEAREEREREAQTQNLLKANKIKIDTNDNNRNEEINDKKFLDQLRESELSTSVLTINQVATVSEPLIVQEDKAIGSIEYHIYKAWLKYNGGCLIFSPIILLALIWLVSLFGTTYVLSIWSQKEDPSENIYYLKLYMTTMGIFLFALASRSALLFVGSVKCSKILNQRMVENILRAPVNLFFDRIPLGRIINRFSKDLTVVDVYLSFSFSILMMSSIGVTTDVIVCVGIGSLYSTIPIIVFFILVFWARSYYMKLYREVVRFEGITRSPIVSFFSETLNGLPIIRCLEDENRFFERHLRNQNENIKNQVLMGGLAGWFTLRVNLSTLMVIVVIVGLCVICPNQVVQVVLVINYAFRITTDIQIFLFQLSDFESKAISFERCLAFTSVLAEREEHCKNLNAIENYTPNWPSQGQIEFIEYSVKYRPGLPKVLHKISFKVNPREKIGIVGRTGSGKSTLFLSLTRILEAHSGSILIDGVRIDALGLTDLRSKITVIPQDAMLYKGSVRDNLDIMHQCTDEQIWSALELVCLKDKFQKGGLDSDIKDDGENLSAGEKQLISIGRAILRQNKIILIDEATSNIDTKTEQAIMNTIKTKLQDCTVLTIAHRLKTVIDSDRILYMGNGKILEFDTPSRLLSNRNSKFYALWEEAQRTGHIIDQQILFEAAV